MKKTNNKGFSLVELIIVIAIMAILIGILAPQYIKYVERSRISADLDLLDSVYGACTTAASDPDVTGVPTNGTKDADLGAISKDAGTWGAEVLSTLSESDPKNIKEKLKSKDMKGKDIKYSVNDNGSFTIECNGYSVSSSGSKKPATGGNAGENKNESADS